jgi:hypothetical protein
MKKPRLNPEHYKLPGHRRDKYFSDPTGNPTFPFYIYSFPRIGYTLTSLRPPCLIYILNP